MLLSVTTISDVLKHHFSFFVVWNQVLILHLNNFRETNQPVIIVALNHRRQPLSLKTMQRYPLIKFFEEPRNQDIFGQLRASRGHILVYDKCGRQQYSFAYPYSWLGYPFTRFVDNFLPFERC